MAKHHVRVPDQLVKIRKGQRSHAKQRFEQRFGLAMNRDHLREIERQIASGLVVLIEKRPQIRNYFVAVEGNLIAVGYNTLTKRVVTALPAEYVELLPEAVVHMARYKLLNDEQIVIKDIVNGRHSSLLYRSDASVSYYVIQYAEWSFKTGYDARRNCLIDFAQQNGFDAHRLNFKIPAEERFARIVIASSEAENIRQTIRAGAARFLWSYSKTVKFYELGANAETFRFGYSKTAGALYRYEDPCEAD